MKKRVLQFIGSFYQGGSERQTVALTRMLHDEGSFDVIAATLNNEGILRSEIEEIGLPDISEFRLTSFYDSNFVRQVRACSKFLRESKIDIVHTHDFYTNVFGMAASSFAGVEVRIASKRETGGMRSRGQEFIEKIAFGRADAIVVNSAAVREHLVTRGFRSEKIKLINNGIDLDRFAERTRDTTSVRTNFGLPVDENIRFVTTVANLRHSVKNIPMLLRTAKQVFEQRPDTHFVIAGEGEMESELKDQAKMLGVADNVHFIGRCDDVPALLSVSHVCTLTSTAEGFSNSIIEYMAAGKPVVATRVGGAAEAIIDGSTGYLVTSDDDQAMAERLIDLIDDDKKAAFFGANGKGIAQEKFSQETRLKTTIELYDSLL